jgi:GT2 family glycosyltransferase
LLLSPVSRHPLVLAPATIDAVAGRPLPSFGARAPGTRPDVSIVVVSHNHLVVTRLCLESVLANSGGDRYELVAVDNGSSDGTAEYLDRLAAQNAPLRVAANAANRGFPAACNQGLAAARGRRLVLLNNDTIVTSGWLARLVAYLDDPRIGLVGPVTNRVGNEAECESDYRTYGELESFAAQRQARHQGRSFDIRTATMFCVAMMRATYERVGGLDEEFGPGLFEDDDYSMRVRDAGLRVVCAEDVFVHHFGGGAFGELAARGEYGGLFHANRRRWEAKWGRPWTPHERRPSGSYRALAGRIREAAQACLPGGARVLVVSRGDHDLLEIPGTHASHFPPDAAGGYAGYHPSDGRDAVVRLEAAVRAGARYLIFPANAFWWLEFYRELGAYLSNRGRRLARSEACLIYELPAAGVDLDSRNPCP